jgi:hypothetical protein
MAGLHLAASVLIIATVAMVLAANGPGIGPAAFVVAAGKGIVILRYFLRIDRSGTGWQPVLYGYVASLCLALGLLACLR